MGRGSSSPRWEVWGRGESLGARTARSLHLPEQAQRLVPQPQPERPPARRGGQVVATAAARCDRGDPDSNVGQAGAPPRLRCRVRTPRKSYLHDPAPRRASKQLAFGAHPKNPDNGFPVLRALDEARVDSGSALGAATIIWGAWGNHLLENLDDVRSGFY